jgi:hypothetical protein
MLDDKTRLIDLTVGQFKELLPKEEKEDENDEITTEDLMKWLKAKSKNTIYNYSYKGMGVAKRGRGKWSKSAVRKFFKDMYGHKKVHIWE